MPKINAEKDDEGEANLDDSSHLEDKMKRNKLKLGENENIEEADKNMKRTRTVDKGMVIDAVGTGSQEGTAELSSDDSNIETGVQDYEPEETADLSSGDSSVGTSKRKGKRGRKKGTKVTGKKQASTIHQFKSSQEGAAGTAELSTDDSNMETGVQENCEPEETADLSSGDSSVGTSKRKGKRGRKKGTKVTGKKQATAELSTDDSNMETGVQENYEPEETADFSSDDSSVGTSKRKGKRGRKKGTKLTGKKQASTIYQFKITLLYTNPVIWRRIQVPKHRFTFGKLHTAITEAMGWSGCFQYCFRIYDTKTDKLIMISRPNPLWQENTGKLIDETNTKITSYFPSRTTVAQYEYDFGDAWLHEVLFEGEVPRRAGEVYPQCVDGERACPPEECGGVGAFEHICEVLKDPKHSEYEEIKSWLEYMSIPDYDPTTFDPKTVKLSKSGDCVWVNK